MSVVLKALTISDVVIIHDPTRLLLSLSNTNNLDFLEIIVLAAPSIVMSSFTRTLNPDILSYF